MSRGQDAGQATARVAGASDAGAPRTATMPDARMTTDATPQGSLACEGNPMDQMAAPKVGSQPVSDGAVTIDLAIMPEMGLTAIHPIRDARLSADAIGRATVPAGEAGDRGPDIGPRLPPEAGDARLPSVWPSTQRPGSNGSRCSRDSGWSRRRGKASDHHRSV